MEIPVLDPRVMTLILVLLAIVPPAAAEPPRRSISGQLPLPECVAAVPVETAPFRARGNEPAWGLEIKGDRLQLRLDDGTREIKAELPSPASLLEGAEWKVRSLAGEPVPDAVAVSIRFLEDNRIAGSSGCNRFMGGYELTGEGLSFGQIAGTMMACPEPRMQIEQRFLGLLQTVTRFEIPADGQLQLITTDGQRITAER